MNDNDETIYPAWANAFAGLIVYLVGVAICFGLTAFVAFEINPVAWGVGGRFIAVVLGVIWSLYFIKAVNEDESE